MKKFISILLLSGIFIFTNSSLTLEKTRKYETKVLDPFQVNMLLFKLNKTAYDSILIESSTPVGYNPWARNYDAIIVPGKLKPITDSTRFSKINAYFADIDVETEPGYGYDSDDATVSVYSAIRDFDGLGDVIIFSGKDWNMGGTVRFTGLSNTTLRLEEGGRLIQIPGRHQAGSAHVWTNPADMTDSNYATNGGPSFDAGKRPILFWFLNPDNITIEGWGAEFVGSYPFDNNGDEPLDNGANSENTYEFQHGLYIENPTGPVTVKGGIWRNFAGDGIHAEGYESDPVIVEDVEAKWNKRIGVALIWGTVPGICKDSWLHENGRGPNVNTDFGTNTRQNFMSEPDKASESVWIEGYNLKLDNGGSSGLGMHISKPEQGKPTHDLVGIFDGIHLESNSTQPDYNRSAEIKIQASDIFNTTVFQEGDSNQGVDPYQGLMTTNRIASWFGRYGLIWTSHYGNNYDISMNNTFSYGNTLLGGNNTNTSGDAVIEWSPVNPSVGTATLQDFDLGDMTIVSVAGKNVPVVMVQDKSNITAIENSVTGNVTYVSDWTGTQPIGKKSLGTLTGNGNIGVTKYNLGSLPAQEMSVVATDNAASEDDLDTAYWTITRTGDTSFVMGCYYEITTSGTGMGMRNNFKELRGSVVFGIGESTQRVDFIPIRDNGVTDGVRTAELTLIAMPNAYTVDSTRDSDIVYFSDVNGETPGPSTIIPGLNGGPAIMISN